MIDLKKFKKVDANKEHTIMEHPDGHQLIIKHKSINPSQHKELRGLKMAKGGAVQDDEKDSQPKQPKPSPTPQPGPISKPTADDFANGMNKAMGFADGGEVDDPTLGVQGIENLGSVPMEGHMAAPELTNPNMERAEQLLSSPSPEQPPQLTNPAMDQGPQNYQLPQARQPQASQDPFGTEAYANQFQKGLGEEIGGIQQKGQAEAKGAEEVAGIAGQGAKGLQALQSTFMSKQKELEGERQALMNDMRAGHIDPGHLFSEMGTVGRIGTAIGLMLGGMGAGVTGGENQALKFLNSQLERDMQGQIRNLDNKNNLLHANYQQMGNLRDAMDMTRIMQSDAIRTQIEAAAARSKSPQAMAAAQAAIGKIDMETAPVSSNLAARRAMLEGQKSGNVSPEAVIHFMVDPKQQAEANKELTTAQSMSDIYKNLLNAFDTTSNMGTTGRAVHPGRVDALVNPLLDQLVKDSAGRVTPTSVDMIKSLFPRALDNAETLSMKRGQLDKFVKEKMHFPILQLYGIQPKTNMSTPNTNVGKDYKNLK